MSVDKPIIYVIKIIFKKLHDFHKIWWAFAKVPHYSFYTYMFKKKWY